MSRIYEALTRATKEKEGATEKFVDERVAPQAKIIADEESSPGWRWSDDGGFSSTNQLRKPHPGLRSWPEKLAELLFGWGLNRYEAYPIVSLGKSSSSVEQYKILRERLKEPRSQKKACSLSITSPVEGDGKTMVAVNLAAAVALDCEEQVLLVDGDLRSPEVHHYFGIRSAKGLSDYLRSAADGDLMSYVQETFLPALKVLPAGKPSGHASELLARGKMQTIMEEIRFKFPSHLVIIDTCPALSTPDPLIVSRHVDGIIMVVRAGKTPRDCLIKAVRSLTSDKLMGIVLNGVERGIASKYYYPHNKHS